MKIAVVGAGLGGCSAARFCREDTSRKSAVEWQNGKMASRKLCDMARRYQVELISLLKMVIFHIATAGLIESLLFVAVDLRILGS